MNNKTLILIGLCICLLFTLPMISAADISSDSDMIDNSVIGSDIDSQAIVATDGNGLGQKGIGYSANASAEEDSGMDIIDAVDDDDSNLDDENAQIDSGKDKNVLSASPLGADGDGNTFSDLKILIENAIASGQPLALDRDFVFTFGEDDALMDGIVISSPITINGGSHTIDGSRMARIFVINSDNVFLNDISFKNGMTSSGEHGPDGGALFIQGNHATLVNCNFINNTARENGGAIYIAGDDCTLNNTVFRDNIAHDDGGAIAWYGDNGKVNNLIASGNSADGLQGNPNGGTLLITGNNISMDRLNISNSRLYKDGGDKSLKGGAIFLTGNNCNITNSVFTNCSVDSTVEDSSGGAIYVLGNNTNIVNCNFTNNSAIEDGGAIFIDGENCTLNHTVFIGNVAHNDGGAIEWNGDNGVIYDLTATGNYADCGNGGSKGGTLLIAGNNMVLDKLNISNTYVDGQDYTGSSAVQGGAIALSGNDCNITNSTFTNCSVVYYKDNSNASGGALYIWGNRTNIVNCNFTNNTASEDGGAIFIDGQDCTLNNTVFIGNVAHNDGGAIEWNGNNGRVYNLTAIGNYADSDEGYYYGNASEGSSKGGTLVLSGNNMVLEKLNISNSRVFANHYNGDKPLQGGAIFLTGNNCNISDSTFNNCSVNYNQDKSYGGAMYIIGNNASLINCNFTKNTAVLGAGAIYIEGSSTFMDNCNVSNNSARNAGGIWISGKENTITNTDISYNKASGNGGGVYYQGNNNTVSYSNIDHNTANNGSNVYMVANMVGGKLIGCNITNGRASNFGGGVEWLQGSKECLIKDCYFFNDTAANHGGGVHWYPGTNGQIDNCTFESCHVDAQKNGGAIYAGATGGTAASGTIISNSKFINCTSGSRGVLTWIGNNGLIVNNTFIDCGKSSGSVNYGGVQALQIQNGKNNQIIGCNFTNCTGTLSGGAIRLQGDNGNVDNITIANCNFDNCSAQESAGAIYMNSPVSNVKLENNTFTGNHAPNYGALDIADAATISSFVNNNFTNNSATAPDGNGGAARLHENINVFNSTFIENSCNGSGGAIYAGGFINVFGSDFENNSAKTGGAIATNNSDLYAEASVFKYNKAESGSAITANMLALNNVELLENQAAFDKWENQNHIISGDHLTVSGTFVGKDNLLNAIKATSGVFFNVTYCGVNGGGVGEGTTNTDDVLSANSYNEVHQIVVMEVYDVNGELKYNVSTYTDEDGNYNFDLPLEDTVVSLVKVYHPEDNYYTGAEYEIVRVPSELSIDCENIYVEDEERITFKVTGSKDTPTGNITVFINDTDGNVIFNGTIPLNASGEANLTLSGLNGSQYYIYANYTGDQDYLPDDENATFNVSKWNSTVEVVPVPTIIYGSLENINITVSSPDATGNFTGNLTVNISSEDAIGFENITQLIELIEDDEGKIIGWTINNMILPVGNYTIDVVYSGNYKYNGNSSKSKFTVLKAEPTVSVNATDINYAETENIAVNVTGVDGGAVPTGNVTVVVTDASGATVYSGDVPIVNGAVTVPVENLPAGDYDITVTYKGDANYAEADAKANFTVRAVNSAVTVNVTNITYGDVETIKFNVTDGATGTVNITVTGADGVPITFNDVPIENGTVGVNVADLPAGNYSVNVTYNGDNNFKPSSAVANFSVGMIDSNVAVEVTNITYGDVEVIKFNVTDGATGTVNITVTGADGVPITFTDVPIENGTVGVNVADLAAGNYTVNLTYNGDNNFNPSSAVANFTVSKATPTLEIDNWNIDYTWPEYINIYITGVDGGVTPTGRVSVVVTNASGDTIYSTTVSFAYGGAYIGVPPRVLSVGDYNITVNYYGDANYTEVEAKANFTVRPIDSDVTVNVSNITYGDTETIKFNVTEGATGTVNITVTGADGVIKTFTDVPIENGTVGINVDDLPAGNYSVNVTYNGDNNFKPSSAVANFSVGMIDSNVAVEVTNITYGDTETIKFNVTDGATGTVNITVIGADGVVATFTDVPIENGTVGVVVADLPAGNYSVNVTYSGDNNYNPSSAVANFSVSKATPIVNVNTTDIDYDDTEPVKVNVTGVDGGEVPTGNVTVIVRNASGDVVFNDTVPIVDGVVTVPVEDLPAGDYDVNVTYNGDSNYAESSYAGSFSVNSINSTVTVEPVNITYGDVEVIKFNVTDGATGTVNITVIGADGVVATFTDVPIENGTVGVNVADLPAGNYSVNVTYNGDNNFKPSSAVANFSVGMIDSNVAVEVTNITYGDTETIKFNVTDGATGTVNITVTGDNGVTKTFTDVPIENGTVGVDLADLAAGNYSVNVTYGGDNNFNPSSAVANFSVSKATPIVNVNTTDIDYDDTEPVKVNVTGVDGGEVPTGNVTVIVRNASGDVVFNDTVPIENGVVTVPVEDLPAGDYDVNVTYNGDSNYAESTYTGSFSVGKIDSNVAVEVTNITYGDTETIKFNVTDGATGTVNITVAGDNGVTKTFTDVPIENGTVGVNVDDLPAGNYSVNVTYGGDNNFNPSSAVANFSVSKASPTVSVNTTDIDYNATEPVKVNVTGVDGGVVPTGNVTVIVTDASGDVVFNDTVPIENGVVTVPVEDLPAGDYDVNVTYNGDSNYAESTYSGSFTVNPINSTVTVDPVNITYGDTETIKFNVTDGATGTVNITVTGDNGVTKTFTDVPIENGTIGVNVADLPAGNYSVNVTYSGDNNFNPSSAVANFTVENAKPTVNVNTTDIDYNSTEPVKFNVTGVEDGAVPTGNVTVIVTDANGQVVYNETVPVADGVVTVPVLPAGDYDVAVTYNGDANYTSATAKANFTINAIDSIVCVDPINITYGDIEKIKFNVTDGATGTFNVTVIGADGVVETYTDVPVAFGPEGVNVFELAAGNYTVNVTYSGDNNFDPSSAVANFTVSKATPNVEIHTYDINYTWDESPYIIVDEVGDGVTPTGNVTVVVTNASGATVYTNTTSLRYGITYVVIPGDVLSAGDYNVTVTYNGDANYTESIGRANFTVRAIDSSVSVDVANITYGDNETIRYNVIEGATGTVNITVIGADGVVVTFNDVPIENGTVGVNVADLAAGNYSVNVTYNGDNNYNPSSAIANFSVSKASSAVNVNTTDIDYNTTEPVKVNVTGVEGGEVPTGNVTVIVTNADGDVVFNDTVPITDGVVNVPVENLPAGDYDVNVTYNGDDNYANSTYTGSFSVNSINSTVTVEPVNITYGDDEVIKFNVTDGATGTVNITVTGADGVTKTFNDVPIENGTVGVKVADLAAGNYTVNVTYNGDNNFDPSSAVANFTVDKATPTVNVNATDIDYDSTEDVVINVTGVDGGVVPTGNVAVVVTDASGNVVFNETVPIQDGVVTVPVEDLPAGDYDVNVTYNGDANYADAVGKDSFKVNKIDSTVDVNTSDIAYGDTETIKITLPEDATGTVNVTVKGPNGFEKTFTDLPVEDDGTVTVPVEDLNAGDYTVDVSYGGDNNYKPHNGTGSFSVDKSTPSVSVEGTDINYGNDETITVNVTGKNITGNVTIIIDGKEYAIDLTQTEDGATAVLNIPGLSAGEHTVEAVYNGDENHYSNQSEDQFEVSKVEPSMEVTPTDIDYGDDEDISISLTGVEGGATPTGTVTVVVTDKNGAVVYYDVVNLEDGKVTVTAEGLPAGDYDVNVTYGGDKNYTSIKGTNQFSVGKIAPTVSVNTTDIDYHDTESIKVNVTGVDDDVPTGNVTVVVTDETGGIVYNDTHDLDDGAVTVPVDGLVAGKYNVTVTYNGDANYRHANDKANFTVNKIDPSILVNTSDIDYHDSETINVSVNDDATGTVSITVTNENGKVVYSGSSDLSGGEASFTVPDLPAGKYDVAVEYSGDDNYNSATDNANFIVNKVDTPVNVETENIIYGEDETINVSVNDDATGDVTITIYKDGVPVYEKTLPVDEATAEFTVPDLNAGKYTVQVAYSGDNNYKPNTAEGEFEVAKANATVEIHVYDIVYGDIEELTVTCNAPGDVTIYVNGASITLPLEDGHGRTLFAALLSAYSGKAQWDLVNLAVGTYPASVHYNGNENYNEADDDDVFHVIKKETSVSVSVDDIKVGEDAVITVELSPAAAPGDLTITVDGKEYTVTPENGKATLKVPGLKAGEHTVTVSYPGSQNYTDSSNETIFTVSKVKPDIETSAPTIEVGKDGKITVTLPKDAKGKVTIEIDGKNYTANVKDGKAVFIISGLKVGKHPIKVYYTGDDKYESAVVDGGDLEVIDNKDNDHKEGQAQKDQSQKGNVIDLSTHATGNPVLALLLVFVFLGFIPLGRKKDNEEDEEENP